MTSSLIQPELPQRRQEVLEIILESDKIVIPVLGSDFDRRKGSRKNYLPGSFCIPLRASVSPSASIF